MKMEKKRQEASDRYSAAVKANISGQKTSNKTQCQPTGGAASAPVVKSVRPHGSFNQNASLINPQSIPLSDHTSRHQRAYPGHANVMYSKNAVIYVEVVGLACMLRTPAHATPAKPNRTKSANLSTCQI
uniref:Uncharacterized protein n=1 Tax=Photinus pyralis TaxID=7054 RepID=A0A1Y1N9F8_PHOPY